MKVTDEMIAAYAEAWEAKRKEIGRGIAEPGTKTRAALEAVFDLIESSNRKNIDALRAEAWDKGWDA